MTTDQPKPPAEEPAIVTLLRERTRGNFSSLTIYYAQARALIALLDKLLAAAERDLNREEKAPRPSDEEQAFKDAVARLGSATEASVRAFWQAARESAWRDAKGLLLTPDDKAPRPGDGEQEKRLEELSRLADRVLDESARAALLHAAAYLRAERGAR
jgi:hypothetical protein